MCGRTTGNDTHELSIVKKSSWRWCYEIKIMMTEAKITEMEDDQVLYWPM